MKVLMAVGEKNLSQILKGNLVDSGFEVAKEEVLHRDYLNEKIDFERPDLLIIHDQQLPSQYTDKEENEQELIHLIESWRRIYDTQMRVVVMCERERRDPFLGQLVSRNVLDIFNERQIPTASFIQQLQSPPKYINVSRYGLTESDINSLMESAGNEEAIPGSKEYTQDANKSLLHKKPRLPKFSKPPMPNINIHFHKQLEEQKEIALQERKIILVVSPYERSGSTFVSHQLAYSIAMQGIGVKYFENPFKNPYTFDRLAGHLNTRNYYSIYSEIDKYDEEDYVRSWYKEGVGLNALNPNLEKPLQEEQFPISRFLRELLSVHDSPYLIVDIGSDGNKDVYDELIQVASHVLVVVDTDIPKLELFSHYQFTERHGWIHNVLLEKKCSLVVNRYVKGVEAAAPLDEFIKIPSFNDATVFESQMAGTLSFKNAEMKKLQRDGLKDLLTVIVGRASRPRMQSSIKRVKNWLPKLEIGKEREKAEEVK